MNLSPISISDAVKFVEQHHRHLPKCSHRLWAIGLFNAQKCEGVAIVGRPTARSWCSSKGEPCQRLEVVRLAVRPEVKNGCSMLYGACSRAAKAMGALDLLTYTNIKESGISLKAANWIEEEGVFGGGQHSRPSRFREQRSFFVESQKRRWWAPWSLYLKGERS